MGDVEMITVLRSLLRENPHNKAAVVAQSRAVLRGPLAVESYLHTATKLRQNHGNAKYPLPLIFFTLPLQASE